MKVLMDLRPCFSGYAGIPYDTRLLMNILSMSSDIELSGHAFPATGSPHLLSYNSLLSDGEIVAQSALLANIEVGVQFSSIAKKIKFAQWVLYHIISGKYLPEKLIKLSPVFHDYIFRRLFSINDDIHYDYLNKISFYINKIPYSIATRVATIAAQSNKINTDNFDIYIGQPPFPFLISKKTKLALRWHDSIPMTHMDTINKPVEHQRIFSKCLTLHKDRAFFVCNSNYTKEKLIDICPSVSERAFVAYCCVNKEYSRSTTKSLDKKIVAQFSESLAVGNKIYYSQNQAECFQEDVPYLLAVGTFEPRKNYHLLLSAWHQYCAETKSELQLIIVGNMGWGIKTELRKIKMYLQNNRGLFWLQNVPSRYLGKIYANAQAVVVPSFEEGFSYSGVESMAHGTPIIASSIPVHQEVYGDAALYFNPYSAQHLIEQIHKIQLMNEYEYNELIEKGKNIFKRYSISACQNQWEEALTKIYES